MNFNAICVFPIPPVPYNTNILCLPSSIEVFGNSNAVAIALRYSDRPEKNFVGGGMSMTLDGLRGGTGDKVEESSFDMIC